MTTRWSRGGSPQHGVRFYELGPGVFSQRYEIHTGGTKAGLIQTSRVAVVERPR